jgi:hypothetical protein
MAEVRVQQNHGDDTGLRGIIDEVLLQYEVDPREHTVLVHPGCPLTSIKTGRIQGGQFCLTILPLGEPLKMIMGGSDSLDAVIVSAAVALLVSSVVFLT